MKCIAVDETAATVSRSSALQIEPAGTDRRVRRQNHECASALIWFALRRALRKAFVVGDQLVQQSLFLRINYVVSDRAPFLCGFAPEGRVHDDL